MPLVTQSNKILHPLFLLCLALLLCNDFWMKEQFSNVITGKLSDFTGLFIFPFFWSAFLPKYTRGIHITTVLIFMWFKSSLSTPVLSWLNGVGLSIGRVVDYTDYVALVSVLLSYYVFNNITIHRSYRGVKAGVIYLSIFSFMATSQIPKVSTFYPIQNEKYYFKGTKRELIQKLNEVQVEKVQEWNKKITPVQRPIVIDSVNNLIHYELNDQYILGRLLDMGDVNKDSVYYDSDLIKFVITQEDGRAKITLLEIMVKAHGVGDIDITKLPYPNKEIRAFKKNLIRPLKNKF